MKGQVVFPSPVGAGLTLRNSLKRLLQCRRAEGVPVGSQSGWARAAAYVSRYLDGEITIETASRRAVEIGLEMGVDIDLGFLLVAVAEVANGAHVAVSPRQVGSDVGLLRSERDKIGNRRMGGIDAVDEPKPQRLRRLKMESARRARRAAQATPREMSLEATSPWEAMGISRRTYFRRKKAVSKLALNRGALLLQEEEGHIHETVPTAAEFHETVPYAVPILERRRVAS